jgi:hypothetical protein
MLLEEMKASQPRLSNTVCQSGQPLHHLRFLGNGLLEAEAFQMTQTTRLMA